MSAAVVEPEFITGNYLVEFDRIGRKHNVPLATFADVQSGPDLADLIYKHARRLLNSTDVDIDVKFDGTGFITVGMLGNGGNFTWKRIERKES